MWGVKRYVTNVCMYAALFCQYSHIITQTMRRTARRGRRGESVPILLVLVNIANKFLCLLQNKVG